MLLEDIQQSHPNMDLYQVVTFLSLGGRIVRKIESRMIILLSEYLDSFSSPSSGGPTVLL